MENLKEVRTSELEVRVVETLKNKETEIARPHSNTRKCLTHAVCKRHVV